MSTNSPEVYFQYFFKFLYVRALQLSIYLKSVIFCVSSFHYFGGIKAFSYFRFPVLFRTL